MADDLPIAEALAAEAASRKELAAAIKSGGKAYEMQRLALEKAVGGKRKIDQANKILLEAEKKATKVVADAEADARRIVEGALEKRYQSDRACSEKSDKIEARAKVVQVQCDHLNERIAELAAAQQALDEQKVRANARDIELDRREDALKAQEAVTQQKAAEIAKFDAWRSAAP